MGIRIIENFIFLPNLVEVLIRKVCTKNSFMKKLLLGSVLGWGIIIWLSACNKETSKSSGQAQPQSLTLSQESVKIGQPLIASLPSGVSASNVRWSISSSDSIAQVRADSGRATFLFLKGGNYRIFASFGKDSSRRDSCSGTIHVSDSVYTPPPPPTGPHYDTIPVPHDTLTISPASFGDSLMLMAQGSRRIGCSPYFLYSLSTNVNSGISLGFDSIVFDGAGGCASPSPAAAYFWLKDNMRNWPNGAYPFSVSYAGATYTGSLTLTSAEYIFTWNYTSGVIIYPKRITR